MWIFSIILLVSACQSDFEVENGTSLMTKSDVRPIKFADIVKKLKYNEYGQIQGRKRILKESEWNFVVSAGESMVNQCPAFAKIIMELKDCKEELTFLYDPDLKNTEDELLKGKVAYYMPGAIYYGSVDSFTLMSTRIIMHEIMHACQLKIAGITFTNKNVDYTEFEALLLYDILNTMMTRQPVNLEGGVSTGYARFVMKMANEGFNFSAVDLIISEASKFFKEKYPNSTESGYDFLLLRKFCLLGIFNAH